MSSSQPVQDLDLLYVSCPVEEGRCPLPQSVSKICSQQGELGISIWGLKLIYSFYSMQNWFFPLLLTILALLDFLSPVVATQQSPCSLFAAAMCFGQLVPVLFSFHLDYLQISSSFPSLLLVLMEAGGGLVCMACLHILPCSAPGDHSASMDCAAQDRFPACSQSGPELTGGQLGTSYQLCCNGDEEIGQIQCRSTKAVFKVCTVLIIQK